MGMLARTATSSFSFEAKSEFGIVSMTGNQVALAPIRHQDNYRQMQAMMTWFVTSGILEYFYSLLYYHRLFFRLVCYREGCLMGVWKRQNHAVMGVVETSALAVSIQGHTSLTLYYGVDGC